MSSRHREGGKGRAVISCCTMCVHFPDGLSSLLPDLVCVVLHSPVFCVSSRTAVVRLHPLTDITRICVEFVTFAVLCSGCSPLELKAWLEEGLTDLSAKLASRAYLSGQVYLFFLSFFLSFFFFFQLCAQKYLIMCAAVPTV